MRRKSLVIPEHLVCLFLRPYRPALHPIARLWQEVKAPLPGCWQQHATSLEHHVERLITHDANVAIRALTSHPDGVRAVHAFCSSRNGIRPPGTGDQPTRPATAGAPGPSAT
jgi:hypothetical protein